MAVPLGFRQLQGVRQGQTPPIIQQQLQPVNSGQFQQQGFGGGTPIRQTFNSALGGQTPPIIQQPVTDASIRSGIKPSIGQPQIPQQQGLPPQAAQFQPQQAILVQAGRHP